MNTSEPEGYEATSKHFKIYDDDDSSDTESDSDTETDSGSDSGIDRINVSILGDILNFQLNLSKHHLMVILIMMYR